MRWVLVGALFVSTVTFAHARLKYPAPRNNNSGIKVGPCGVAKTNTPTVFTSGQTITVSWEETIDHPGHYRVAYSAGSPAPDNDFDQNILANNINNPAGEQALQSVSITLPNLACSNCTLQLIQVMTNTNPPSNYYSCADFALVAPPDAGTPDAGTADAGVIDAGTIDAGSGGGAGGGSGGGAGGGSGGGSGGGAGGGSAGGTGGGSGGGAGGEADGGSGENQPAGSIPVSVSDGGTEFDEVQEAYGGVGCSAAPLLTIFAVPLFIGFALRRRRR